MVLITQVGAISVYCIISIILIISPTLGGPVVPLVYIRLEHLLGFWFLSLHSNSYSGISLPAETFNFRLYYTGDTDVEIL